MRPVFIAVEDENGILIDRFPLNISELTPSTAIAAPVVRLIERLQHAHEQAQKRYGAGDIAAGNRAEGSAS